MEEQISSEVAKFTIMPKFRDWALEVLRDEHKNEVKERTKIVDSLQKAASDKQSEIDNLTKLRLRDLVDDEEFKRTKTQLKDELLTLRNNRQGAEERTDRWIKHAEGAFNFVTSVKETFDNGDSKTRRDVLAVLGQNLTMSEGRK